MRMTRTPVVLRDAYDKWRRSDPARVVLGFGSPITHAHVGFRAGWAAAKRALRAQARRPTRRFKR